VVYWTRQTGRQKSKWERTERQFSKSTTEGEGALPLLTCLQRVPSSPFLMYPVLPCWLPGSMLLQTPKEELRNQKISPVCPQKRCCGPRGRHRMGSVDRKQRKGVQEEAFGLGVGGKQCISHLRNPLFPLSKHRAQYLEKKKREREREKKFFGFLAAAGHHPPKRRWAGGRGRAHVNGRPRIPGSFGHMRQQQQLTTNK